jgi:ribosomal 50S subunit-recycling heat shock protein
LRLDAFLKRVGLIKQRSLAKEICDRGLVSVDGRLAKPGKEVEPGRIIQLELSDHLFEIEILSLPDRNYRRKQGEAFYEIIRHECIDPLA